MGGRSRGNAAFTMFEILVVIAIIVVLASVLITGAIHLTRNTAMTPEDVFWRAVVETRRMALLSGREVRMSYSGKDEKERALIAHALDGTEVRFPFEGQLSKLTVDFLSAQKGGSSMLLGGQLVETQTVPFVTFYGDGTCSPFRLQIQTGGGEPRILMIDPWTCALVLPATDDKR